MSAALSTFRDLVASASAEAVEVLRETDGDPLWLYYREGGETEPGELRMMDCPEEGDRTWHLAGPEPLRGDVPARDVARWIEERSRRLPILASSID